MTPCASKLVSKSRMSSHHLLLEPTPGHSWTLKAGRYLSQLWPCFQRINTRPLVSKIQWAETHSRRQSWYRGGYVDCLSGCRKAQTTALVPRSSWGLSPCSFRSILTFRVSHDDEGLCTQSCVLEQAWIIYLQTPRRRHSIENVQPEPLGVQSSHSPWNHKNMLVRVPKINCGNYMPLFAQIPPGSWALSTICIKHCLCLFALFSCWL